MTGRAPRRTRVDPARLVTLAFPSAELRQRFEELVRARGETPRFADVQVTDANGVAPDPDEPALF